jgi:hypothetical protein
MLTRSFLALKVAPLVTCVLLTTAGCTDQTEPNLPPLGPGAAAAGPGPGPGPEPPIDLSKGTPTIRQIMGRLTKGPNSLTPVIGKELEAEAPDWNTIQPQTEEYARLAAAMEKSAPRKGSPESWAKLSATYSESARALDKAAKAKNRDAALEAHSQITGSCMECHRAHRQMGPGMGKMGGPRPGGPPPGGLPPGGPPGGDAGKRLGPG